MKPYDLTEAALRGRLFARDGVEGDRVEGERAFFRAAGEPPSRSAVDPKLLREVKTGGRRAPVRVYVGDRAGNSVVLEAVGRQPNGERTWLVTCSGCGRPQVRDTSAFNYARRAKRELLCPECISETGIGVRMERAALIMERVRAGGPIYTYNETRWLQDKVREDLEVEFGKIDEEAGENPSRWQTAAGYPWSSGGRGATLTPDNHPARNARSILDQQHEKTEDDLANKALGRLANAVASGDRETILAAEAEVAGSRKRRSRGVVRDDGYDIGDRVECPTDPSPPPCATRVARVCLVCRQRFCGTSAEVHCSRRCVAIEAARARAMKSEAALAEARKLQMQAAAAKAETDARAAMKAVAAQRISEAKRLHTVANFQSLIGSVARSEPGRSYSVVCTRCMSASPGAYTTWESVHRAMSAGFRGIERAPGIFEPACASCQRVRWRPSDLYRFQTAERYVIASKWQTHLFMRAHTPGQFRWGPRETAREFTPEEIDREIYVHEVDDLFFVVVGRKES